MTDYELTQYIWNGPRSRGPSWMWCQTSQRIQLGWRDFTGFSPRIQQFSSRFRRELLNSLRESSNSRRMFSNSRRRIRRELLILQKITTKREKRKVNLVATENWTILCCDENSYSRWDENWPILCCEENSNSRRDEICPILCCEENSNSRRDEICPVLCCEENSNSRRDEICPVLCCDENSNSRWDENCPILCCDEICPILYNLENMYQAVRGVFFLITSWQCSDKIRKYQGHIALLLGHWYEIMALYYVKSFLTEISASRQDRRVLQKSKIIRIEFLSKWGMLQTSRYV